MTRLLANVVGPEIRVNAVAPGLIETPWTRDFTEIAAKVRAETPLRRVGDPDDVAEAVAGLARSTYVTGQVLLVETQNRRGDLIDRLRRLLKQHDLVANLLRQCPG